MAIRKSDISYLLMAIFVSAVVALAAGSEDSIVRLFVILGIFGIALIIGIFLKPSLGAFVLIVAIFTNISSQITDQGYPGVIQPIVMIVFAGIFAHYIYTGRRLSGHTKTAGIELWLFLYFLVVILSFLVASYKLRAMTRILDMAKDFVIIYCIIFALQTPTEWKRASWVIIITTAILCLLGVYQVATGNYDQTFFGLASVRFDQVLDSVTRPRLGGPINAPNLWGQVLVAVLPLIIYRIVDEPRRIIKFISVLIMGLIFFAILNTYSRGAYLALLIVLGFIFLERKLNPLIILASLGLFLSIILFAPTDYVSRFETLLSLSPASDNGIYQDSSLRGRSSEILAGQRMFLEHPLLGVGVGNYENNYQKYAQEIGIEVRLEERQAHSLYVQILAETGLLGAITFGGFVLTLMVGLYRARQNTREIDNAQSKSWRLWMISIQFSVISYLTTSLFLHGAYIRYFWVLVALAITGIQLTKNIRNNSNLPDAYEGQF